MLWKEIAQSLVSSDLHRLNLLLRPRVHLHRTDKTQMNLCIIQKRQTHSKSAMLAGTLQTHEYSVGNGGPLGSSSSAVDANLLLRHHAIIPYVVSWHLTELCKYGSRHAIHFEWIVDTRRQQVVFHVRPLQNTLPFLSSSLPSSNLRHR